MKLIKLLVLIILINVVIGEEKIDRVFRVIIDVGHGGRDAGITANEVVEKDINLEMALLLKEKLIQEPNIQVMLTRESDVEIPIENRTSFANKNKGDVFISIHANYSQSADVTGFRIYFYKCRPKTARYVPTKWNDVQSFHINKSINFADIATNHIKNAFPDDTIISSEEKILLLKGLDIPGILFEIGFLSNEYDTNNITSSQIWKDNLVTSLSDAIKEFLTK